MRPRRFRSWTRSRACSRAKTPRSSRRTAPTASRTSKSASQESLRESDEGSMSFFLGDDEADRGPGPGGAPPTGPGTGAAVAVVDADQALRSRLAMQLGDYAMPLPSITALAD